MSKQVTIESIDYYESSQGLLCFLRDNENQVWSKIITEDDADFYPRQVIILTSDWSLKNGKTFNYEFNV